MAQAPGLSYRPSMGREKLMEIVVRKLHQRMNSFIDEAVKEKIVRTMHQDSEIEKLGLDIGKFLCERDGWNIYEPGHKLNKKLDVEIKNIKSGKTKYKKIDI